MSLLKTNGVQIGQSATATNNFVWYQPTIPDGTIRLANGNSGAQTDIVTINSSGNATFVGSVIAAGTSSSAADIKLYEDTDNGTNYVALKAPESIAANVTWTLPSTDGTSGQALVTNGSGTMSWAAAGAVLTDDTTTNASYYIGLSASTTGSWTSAKVSSTKLYFNPSTGTLNSTIFNTLSDATQKSDVARVGGADAVRIMKQLNGVEYRLIDGDKKSSGVIAQELELVLPFLVDTNENGIKSVNYNGLIAYLIEANKNLIARVEVLESK